MGLVISNKCLVYILIMGLGPEFGSWSTAVRNPSRATSKPFAFDTLTAQLLDEDTYWSTTEVASVALLSRARNSQKASKSTDPPKHKCKHCGYNHLDDNCYHKYPEKAPPGWKRKSPKGSKEEKSSTADKPLLDLNEYGFNFMSLSYATYENRNPEHQANFKAITDIPSSAVDTLKIVWVIDSGTTDHMNSNQTSFKTYQTFETAKAIYTGGGTIYAYGVGVIELFAKPKEGPPRKVTLHNVLHVPSLITNLISISALRQKGAYWRTDTLTLHLTSDNQQFARCREIGKLFALEEENAARTVSGGSTALVTMKTPVEK